MEPTFILSPEVCSARLQVACFGAQREIAEILINRGAAINAPSSGSLYGTALQTAAREGDEQVVEMLLSRGADVRAQEAEEVAIVHSRQRPWVGRIASSKFSWIMAPTSILKVDCVEAILFWQHQVETTRQPWSSCSEMGPILTCILEEVMAWLYMPQRAVAKSKRLNSF